MLNNRTKQHEGYIYCITNVLNDKKYIGQTIQKPSHRWAHHKCANGRKFVDTYIDRAIAKYGEDNFKFEVIDTIVTNTKEELYPLLDKAEISYINSYHSLWNENGYNVSSGGQNAGNNRVSTKNAIDIYDINGNLLCPVSSKTEVMEYTGCAVKMISGICNGTHHNYKKQYVFRNHLESFDKYDTSVFYRGEKKIDVFDSEWNYIETLNSVNDVVRKYNTGSTAAIITRCKGQCNSPYKHKYNFKYAA